MTVEQEGPKYELKCLGPKDIELKADPDKRIIYGFASTYDLDNGRDIVIPGAFKKTIAERGPQARSSDPIVVKYNHKRLLGMPIEMEEKTGKGLYTELRISRTTDGNNLLELARDGVPLWMSMGYFALKQAWVDGNRQLKEVALKEYSILDEDPMNRKAIVMGVKSLDDIPRGELRSFLTEIIEGVLMKREEHKTATGTFEGLLLELKEGRMLSAASLSDVETCIKVLQALVERAKRPEPAKPLEDGETAYEPPNTAPPPEVLADMARYAGPSVVYKKSADQSESTDTEECSKIQDGVVAEVKTDPDPLQSVTDLLKEFRQGLFAKA